MRSVRIVTFEANLHAHLLSKRVEDFQTPTLRLEAFGSLRSALSFRRMIEDMTVRNSPPPAAPIRVPQVRLDARTCALSL